MNWCNEKNGIVDEALEFGSLGDAKSRLQTFGIAVKSIAPATKNLSEMSRELARIGQAANAGDQNGTLDKIPGESGTPPELISTMASHMVVAPVASPTLEETPVEQVKESEQPKGADATEQQGSEAKEVNASNGTEIHIKGDGSSPDVAQVEVMVLIEGPEHEAQTDLSAVDQPETVTRAGTNNIKLFLL